MKNNNIVMALLAALILVSCGPSENVAPTETALPAFTPTLPPLPVATPTPDDTPRPAPISQAWLDAVHETEGGWKIDNVSFDPDSLVSFPPSHEAKIEDSRRFGPQGEGQVNLQCYGEILLPSGEKVITGLQWWQNIRMTSPSTWEGIGFALGIGIAGGPERGQPYCINTIKGWLETGTYRKSFNLVFEPYQFPSDSDWGKLMTPLAQELTPPTEFWQTGDTSLLPAIDGKPFLLATDFEFIKDE